MSDLISYLYHYSSKTYFPHYLYGDSDYVRADQAAERAESWLEEHLDETAREHLVLYTDNQNEVVDLTRRAAFLCGLSMGLELSRLGQLPG